MTADEHSPMQPVIEPTAGPYSPLFELRAWRLELDRMGAQFADNAKAMEAIIAAKAEVAQWIRTRENRK